MNKEELLEKRRAGFEESYPAPYFVLWSAVLCVYYTPPNGAHRKKALHQYNELWHAWNSALDSVEIELPNVTVSQCITAQECRAIRCGIDMCRFEIEEQGYKVKP